MTIGDEYVIEHVPWQSFSAAPVQIKVVISAISQGANPDKVKVDSEFQKGIVVRIKDLKTL